jgi:hypothetical protein
MNAHVLAERHAEFNDNIWDHAVDAFQTQFDQRRQLSDDEKELLREAVKIASEPEDDKAALRLRQVLRSDIQGLSLLLQVLGLTRSKILSDLKGSAQAKTERIAIPSSHKNLPYSTAWKLAGPYLVARIRSVFGHAELPESDLDPLFECLNQATWPGYIRQERAKRSGHEAEYRLATLFSSVGIPFQPAEKADNPMCKDAQIGGISFDLVVPHVRTPAVVIKSTVHTANIGQYGESKDHLEVDEAKNYLDSNFKPSARPLLLALIDGVGFRSNRAGLTGVLQKADEFCQFRTIWKGALVASDRVSHPVELALETDAQHRHEEFIRRYGGSCKLINRASLKDAKGWLEAGEALIRPS